MTFALTVCTHCRHFRGFWKCLAYPDRIPKDFALGLATHVFPRPDDHGYQFVEGDAFKELMPQVWEYIQKLRAKGSPK